MIVLRSKADPGGCFGGCGTPGYESQKERKKEKETKKQRKKQRNNERQTPGDRRIKHEPNCANLLQKCQIPPRKGALCNPRQGPLPPPPLLLSTPAFVNSYEELQEGLKDK